MFNIPTIQFNLPVDIIREYLRHDGKEVRVAIHRDGKVTRNGVFVGLRDAIERRMVFHDGYSCLVD